MKKSIKQGKSTKPNQGSNSKKEPRGRIIVSAIFGILVAFSVYLSFFQRHFISKTYLLLSIGIGFFAAVGFYILFRKFIASRWLILEKSRQFFLVSFSFLFSLLILSNLSPHPFFALVPETEFRMDINFAPMSLEQEDLRLLYLKNELGFIHFSELNSDCDWQIEDKNILIDPAQNCSIVWESEIGPESEIAFKSTDIDAEINIEWGRSGFQTDFKRKDGLVLEAQADGSTNFVIRLKEGISWIYYFPFYFSSSLILFSLIFVSLLGFGTVELQQSKYEVTAKTISVYLILPAVVWLVTLLVFWPGFMTSDSLSHWRQVASGDYSSWSSLIYTLIINILTRLWYSPAAISLTQIISMLIVLGYGFKVLLLNKVHKGILWGISILFASSPVNMIFLSTLWKDIAYGISFLWLSIIMLNTYLSDGGTLDSTKAVVSLILALAAVALFRNNGIAISLAVLLLLFVAYPNRLKPLLFAAGVFSFMFLIVLGPVKTWLSSGADGGESQVNLIFLHHIAAHVEAGTVLTNDERIYLESFLPLNDWDYRCHYVGPISYEADFDRQKFLSSTGENLKLALNLIIRDPSVNFRHALCAGEIAWRVKSSTNYMKSTHGFHSWALTDGGWLPENELGLEEASAIPQLVQPYKRFLRWFGFADDNLAWFLRPAFSLYLIAFFSAGLYLREKNWRIWLVALPSLTQSATLFLIGFAPAYRYQWGTYLVGLFSLGLISVFSSDKTQE